MAHTPMEELIEWIGRELKLKGYEHEQIIAKATSLLPQERQMVIDAYTAGQKIMIDVVSEILPIVKTQSELQKVFDGEDNEDADQYFNNKFKK